MSKSNLVIHSGKSEQTRRNDMLNRQHSTLGQQEYAAGMELQKEVQGELNALVRESEGHEMEDRTENWLGERRDMQPKAPRRRRSSAVTTYALRNGQWVPIHGYRVEAQRR